MGYDCTLHVVDENAIRDRFVPRLLNESSETSPFDARDDADELWSKVREMLIHLEKKGESPRETASVISQLAIAWAAAELPYHYERGFCLSMWDTHQEEAVSATFPKKYRGNPESMFAAVVQQYPALRGQFPGEIESNFCPGIYVPADKVPGAVKWVERKVRSFEKPYRRLFRGLILVLKEAAKLGMAYWEGTDLPVSRATIYPPASERKSELEEWINPDGVYMQFLTRDGPTLVFAHGIGFPQDCRTVHIDVREWPPRTVAVWNEYAISAAKSVDGRWVTVSRTTGPGCMYRARLRDSADTDPIVLVPPEERENGLGWAGFIGSRVIAVLKSLTQYPNWDSGDHTGVLFPAYPLLEEAGRLAPRTELQPSKEKHPEAHAITLCDGSNVFLWDRWGYEFVNGKFTATFDFPGRSSADDGCAVVPFEPDGFYCYNCYDRSNGGLFSVRRGAKAIRHLPKVDKIEGITPGPDESILVHERGDRGDIGKLYFPGEETYVRIEPELFDDEDPEDIRSLHYIAECERLIAATPKRLWAVPIAGVLALPRYNATTGKKQRSKSR